MDAQPLMILDHLWAASSYMPELFMAAGALVLLMVGVFMEDEDRAGEAVSWLAMLLLAGSTIMLIAAQPTDKTTLLFNDGFVIDNFTRFMKVLTLLGAVGAIFISLDYFRDARLMKFEYPVLALLATTGMLMMISANDLIALYLGLELQSLALYVMAAFRRDSVRSSEAGLKYFVLGALSSGMLLYGCSLIYGFTGSTNFSQADEV